MSVAVVVVTHDDAADVPGCLQAVAAQSHRPLSLWVVDSGSSDGSAEAARASWPAGVAGAVLPLPDNVGFAAGMNHGLAASREPWVLSLNADARPRPDYVERLLAAAEGLARLRVGAVTGRLLRWHDGPATLDACGMRLTPAWRHLDRESGRPDRHQRRRRERVFGATGAASSFRREALEDVALDGEVLDPRFHSFREDAELCFRLRERGWEVLYEPAAVALHRRWNLPERRAALPSAVNYHSLKNRYLLRAYHQTVPNLLWTLPWTLGRDLAALAWVLLRERSSLAAYGWLWRHRREIAQRRRRLQARRTVPWWTLERWFLRSGAPP